MHTIAVIYLNKYQNLFNRQYRWPKSTGDLDYEKCCIKGVIINLNNITTILTLSECCRTNFSITEKNKIMLFEKFIAKLYVSDHIWYVKLTYNLWNLPKICEAYPYPRSVNILLQLYHLTKYIGTCILCFSYLIKHIYNGGK